MADTTGQADIRGIDIQKAATGFADEEFIFKNFLTITPTTAREIRWYSKTAGVLDSTDTTGITASQIANTSSKSRPVVVEPSWTRNNSYVRKYFVESPWISNEDLDDTDPDIIVTIVRDLTRSIANQVDARIFDVVTESQTPVNINATNAAGTGWDDLTNGNPIVDLLSGAMKIRQNGYSISDIVVWMNPVEYKNLLNYIITVKGSSIPALASEKAQSGVLMSIVGQKIVVSNNALTDNVVQLIPNMSAKWKTFTPITARWMEEVGIGKKFRVWEEGEVLLEHPKSVCLIQDTVT